MARPAKPTLTNSSNGQISGASAGVSISGMGLLLSRQFGIDDPSADPVVETRIDRAGMEMNPVQGADLKYVDGIAFDLGRYRHANNGQIIASMNSGGTFDIQGHSQTFDFSEKDTTIAQRILNSDSMNSTSLDRGFLKFTLDPGYGLDHVSHFEFLEQMVNYVSDGGTDAGALAPKFSNFVNRDMDYVVHTADKVTLHVFAPDVDKATLQIFGLNAAGGLNPESEPSKRSAELKAITENYSRTQGFLSIIFDALDSIRQRK